VVGEELEADDAPRVEGDTGRAGPHRLRTECGGPGTEGRPDELVEGLDADRRRAENVGEGFGSIPVGADPVVAFDGAEMIDPVGQLRWSITSAQARLFR